MTNNNNVEKEKKTRGVGGGSHAPLAPPGDNWIGLPHWDLGLSCLGLRSMKPRFFSLRLGMSLAQAQTLRRGRYAW